MADGSIRLLLHQPGHDPEFVRIPDETFPHPRQLPELLREQVSLYVASQFLPK
jgi:hypothetical protein